MDHTTSFILVINPGSTSTKLAIFRYGADTGDLVLNTESIIRYGQDELPSGTSIVAQLDLRTAGVREFIRNFNDKDRFRVIMARGGPLRPLQGGVYEVNEAMLDDLRECRYADHASNLAALIGAELRRELDLPLYIADPVTVDEFTALARISGVPGIERKCRSHALNIKATARKAAERLDKDLSESRFVVAHMGGGISIAALDAGRIVDVNDALLGMGPFGPERAGALPLAGVLDLAYDHAGDRPGLERLLTKSSGLAAYLGTADLEEVEERIEAGDTEAQVYFEAMVYQISKEIAAMASVLHFNLDGIILTGGMSQSQRLIRDIKSRIGKIGPVLVYPGEMEMEALAQAGARILAGKETIHQYTSES